MNNLIRQCQYQCLSIWVLTHLSFLLAGLSLTGCSTDSGNENQADVVYINGAIYTVNQRQKWVDSIAIKDGKFTVVGTRNDVG